MLIREAVQKAELDGKLIRAKPIAPWEGEPRVFLMCRPLYEAIEEGKASPGERQRRRWATLEAAISYFITGGYVTDDLIKQLAPPRYEHWELRSRKPKPSIRVFGRFVLPDIFVGTHLQRRDKLGGMWSKQFEHEKLVCEDHWRNAGMTEEPFSDPPLYRYTRYITSNAQQKIKVMP